MGFLICFVFAFFSSCWLLLGFRFKLEVREEDFQKRRVLVGWSNLGLFSLRLFLAFCYYVLVFLLAFIFVLWV
jgi:hypothetical protein